MRCWSCVIYNPEPRTWTGMCYYWKPDYKAFTFAFYENRQQKKIRRLTTLPHWSARRIVLNSVGCCKAAGVFIFHTAACWACLIYNTAPPESSGMCSIRMFSIHTFVLMHTSFCMFVHPTFSFFSGEVIGCVWFITRSLLAVFSHGSKNTLLLSLCGKN